MKVIRSLSFDVPDIERLRALILKLGDQYPDKTIFVIADMSVFHHLKKSKFISTLFPKKRIQAFFSNNIVLPADKVSRELSIRSKQIPNGNIANQYG